MTGRCRILSVFATLVVATALPRAALPAEALRFNHSEAQQLKDDATAAKEFSTGVLSLALPLSDLHVPGEPVEVRCAVFAGIKGVKVDLNLRLFDLDSNLLGQTLESAKTKKDGWTQPIVVPPPIEGFPLDSIFTAVADPLGNKKTNEIKVVCIYGPEAICDGSEAPTCS